MSITVACPSCRKALKAPDNAAGRKVKCPKCGTVLIIPAPQQIAAPFEDLSPPAPTMPPSPARRSNRAVLFMIAGGGALAVFLLVGVLILIFGTRGSRSSSPGTKAVAANESNDKPNPTAMSFESQAKQVLKAALDSWIFGDTLDQFEKKHPGYNFIEPKWSISQVVLLRYEIGLGRAEGPSDMPPGVKGYEFAVVLVFQSQAGMEIKENRRYAVRTKDDKAWTVFQNDSQASAKPPQEKRKEVKIDAEKDAGQAKQPEQPKEPLEKQKRAKLLLELEAKRREALPALQEENRQLEAALEQLRKEEAALRRNPRFGDPFNKQVVSQFNALLKKQRSLATRIQKSREALDQKVSDFEQERRQILHKFPEPGDPKLVEHKGLLYTQEELDRRKAFEEEHAKPRKVAASYMRSLIAKGLVSRPAFAGFYKNPKGKDSYAIAYKVASVNGRKVLGDTVHLYVFKDKQGYWQVSAFSQDGVHVKLGPPPREFQSAPDPGKEE